MSSFCTVINCIDGRVRTAVNRFARVRFLAEHVDTITEPGAVRYIPGPESPQLASILGRLEIALTGHGSRGIIVAAHHDCAGNPIADEKQLAQLPVAIAYVAGRYLEKEIVALWANDLGYCYEVGRE